VVAVQDTGRPGPTVILRADTDALLMMEQSGEEFASEIPHVAHACGHDAHTAMLLGAARLLAARRERLRGRVVFVFQPGEEGYDGASVLLNDGLLDDVAGRDSYAFAVHVTPNLPTGVAASRAGTLMASTDGVSVELHGVGGHAGMPETSRNPVPAAGELALRLSQALPGGAAEPLLTVTSIQAGTTHNVIPDIATTLYTLRCLTEESRSAAARRVEAEVTAVAQAHGVAARTRTIVSYPCTVNDTAAVALAAEAAASPAVGLQWIDLPDPVRTAEDFAYFLHRWPGCLVLLGACPPEFPDPAAAPGCHAPRMRLDEAVLPLGAVLHVDLATRICGRADDGDPATGKAAS
jgi:hippurate hydrolase